MKKDLSVFLEALYNRFHHLEHVAQDPLFFPRQYAFPSDQEVVGFIAASLAFGNAGAFMAKIADLLFRLGPCPIETLSGLDEGGALEIAESFTHRFVGQSETASLLRGLGRLVREKGGLKPVFLEGFRKHGHIYDGLTTLACALAPRPNDTLRGPGFLVPVPAPSHASKRLHLFLRWMVRRDGIDLGLWQEISPKDLVIPLDVHVFRVAGYLGLLPRRHSGPRLRDAIALTEALRRFDQNDPVRFDFALSHLGISRACRGRADREACPACPLVEACVEALRL